ARVDRDLADVFRILQSDELPALSGVRGLVEAGSKMCTPLAGVLPGAQPQHIRILRLDDDAAEAEGFGLPEEGKNLFEGNAAVLGLPQPTERRGDVPDARVPGVDLDEIG